MSNTKCSQALCVRNGALCTVTFRHRKDCSSRHEYQEDRRDGWGAPDLSPLDFFLWHELKTQLVQHPAPANPEDVSGVT